MGFLQKTRVVILGNLNELLDKQIDMNSIPVLKQYIRDMEDALDQAQHQRSVARAQVVTRSRDLEVAKDAMAADERRAQAYLSSNDEKSARLVAGRIHDEQENIANLQSQIAAANAQASQLDAAVETLRSRHDSTLNRVRILQGKDATAKAMEKGATAVKNIGAAIGTGVDSSIDDVSRRIDERSDLAQQEFTDAMGSIEAPPDPLKDKAVDDILAGLKEKAAAPVAS